MASVSDISKLAKGKIPPAQVMKLYGNKKVKHMLANKNKKKPVTKKVKKSIGKKKRKRLSASID